MLYKLLSCAAVALVLFPGAASAQGRPLTESRRFDESGGPTADDSSAALVRDCGGGEGGARRPSLACASYFDGMLSMHALMVGFGSRPQFCLPSAGIRLDEARRAFLDYVAADPGALEQSARINVMLALRQSWPCRAELPAEAPPPRQRSRPR